MRARLERANEMRDPTGVGGSPREGPKREASKKKGRGKTNCVWERMFVSSLFLSHASLSKKLLFQARIFESPFRSLTAPSRLWGARWFEWYRWRDVVRASNFWGRLGKVASSKGEERERQTIETRNVEREEKKQQVLFCKKREKHTKQRFSLPPRAPGFVCFFEGFGGREKRERRRD